MRRRRKRVSILRSTRDLPTGSSSEQPLNLTRALIYMRSIMEISPRTHCLIHPLVSMIFLMIKMIWLMLKMMSNMRRLKQMV
jgi:hypothetical protein